MFPNDNHVITEVWFASKSKDFDENGTKDIQMCEKYLAKENQYIKNEESVD